MDENPRTPSRKASIKAACIGFFFGAAIPVAIMLPLAIRRWRWAHEGGRGEAAMWGEPVFYMIGVGAPVGIVGAIAAMAITRVAVRNR